MSREKLIITITKQGIERDTIKTQSYKRIENKESKGQRKREKTHPIKEDLPANQITCFQAIDLIFVENCIDCFTLVVCRCLNTFLRQQ